jgi:hypothetical protein
MKKIKLSILPAFLFTACLNSTKNIDARVDSLHSKVLTLKKDNLQKQDSIAAGNINDSMVREISLRAMMNELEINDMEKQIDSLYDTVLKDLEKFSRHRPK